MRWIFKWWWRDKTRWVRCLFKPRNRWAVKIIPREWNDLDTIYENILYAGIINYVEEEDCFNVVRWDTDEESKAAAIKIKEIYEWAKTGRALKDKELSDSYPENVDWRNPLKGAYDKSYELEGYILKKDTEYLTWLIQNRKTLWT